MTVTIYHNPRCTKSRKTLELLRSNGIEPEIIEYLCTPPDQSTIKSILTLLGLTPRQLMRPNEPEYKNNNLGDDSLKEEHLIDAMVKIPKLIERPIVLANGKAIIGRPPENALKIL